MSRTICAFCGCLLFLFATLAFAQPRIFGEGVISGGDNDSHPTFSDDGNTLYFVRMAPDFSKWTIYTSRFTNGKWEEPQVAPFSGKYWDADPFLTQDGKTLYFISNRPLKPGDPQKDFDIWKMQWQQNGWSEPTRLDPPINSEASEYYPTQAKDGTLYFGSRRKGGKGASDLYASKPVNGKYETAQNLSELNTAGNEFEPFVAPDQSFVIFMSAPGEHLEETNLFISYNTAGTWSKPVQLPEPFNSDAMEFSPKLSPDGKTFYFSSARNVHPAAFDHVETTSEMNRRIRSAGNGLLDIYQVDFHELQNALRR